MTIPNRIITLLTAIAVAIPLSLPLAPTASAYRGVCVDHRGAFNVNAVVEFKRRRGGPDYGDWNDQKGFDTTRSVRIISGQISPMAKSFFKGLIETDWLCATAEELGNPAPGTPFSVRVEADWGPAGGISSYCQLRPEHRHNDNGQEWHKVHVWADTRNLDAPFAVRVDGTAFAPKCRFSDIIKGPHMWRGCVEGPAGFRNSACYAWRPRVVTSLNLAHHKGKDYYYFDPNVDHGRKKIPLPGDPVNSAYFFADRNLAAHLASVLRRGAHPEKPGAEGTPLELAIKRDRPEIARVLLLQHESLPQNNISFPANPNKLNSEGLTPMHMAALRGQWDIVEMMLLAGGNPNARSYERVSPTGSAGDIKSAVRDAGLNELVEFAPHTFLTPFEMAMSLKNPVLTDAQANMFRMMKAKGADLYGDEMEPLLLAAVGNLNPGFTGELFRVNLRGAIQGKDEKRMAALAALVRSLHARDGGVPAWADPNQPLQYGAPALVRTFQSGFPAGAKHLALLPGIRLTPDLLADSDAALEFAQRMAQENNTEMLDALFAAGVPPNPEYFYSPPVSPEMGAILGKHGGLDLPYKDGKTPLQDAASWNEADGVRALLEWGADPDIVDQDGRTALEMAVYARATHSALALLEAGADASGSTMLHWLAARSTDREWGAFLAALLEAGMDPNPEARTPERNWTPLRHAIEVNAVDAALALLEHGAEAREVDATQLTTQEGGVSAELFVALADAGMKLDPLAATPEGEPLLHWAARLGNMEIFRAIADEAGDDDLRVESGGRTALEVARESGSDAAARYLEDRTKDMSAFNENGDTVLHVAACNNDRAAARRWLNAGADPNQFNRNGFSSLHDMVIIREECWRYPGRTGPDAEVVRILLEGGADPNLPSAHDAGADYKVGGFECCGRVVQYQGKTALQMAAMSGFVKLAEMMLEYGGDPLIRGGNDPENGNTIDNALYPQWYVQTFPNSRKVQFGRKLEEEYGGN